VTWTVQDVQAVQPLRSVQNGLNDLNGLNPLNGHLSVLSVERAGRENLLDVEPPLGKPLLNRVIQQRL
jgi:hypothetical protein